MNKVIYLKILHNMNKYKYEELLDRAIKDLPEEIIAKDRFQMPVGVIYYEGNTTILKNLGEISDKVNRDKKQIFTYILKEVGTAGEMNDRVVLQGKIPEGKIQDCIKRYVTKYVLCRECGRPDTKMIKKNRVLMLKCEACGAIRPIEGKIKKS